ILGKNGQLGKAFLNALQNEDTLGLDKEDCDISDFDRLKEVFDSYRPDIVLNCSAYNFVDKAETDFPNAYKTNAYGVKSLAYLCKQYNAYFITYSTDYVFDGKKEGLYKEEDMPNPINEYGKSKLTGEIWTLEEGLESYLIFRTSWVYGDGTQNFVYKLLNWAKNNDILKIAIDEFSVPTPADFLVEKTLKAIDKNLSGLYHLVPNGYASRYEWAKLILKVYGIKKIIIPVSKEVFNLPARRPDFSALDSSKIQKDLNENFEEWNDLLRRFY
ncbi:MAG TPA: dTDP-4-dehydrorhamnose reductase, partial [Hydrogenobaculum sp.]|nr:dTDP-4-dehydrorhamnose reductase [Hydrogenobaculum sp.]